MPYDIRVGAIARAFSRRRLLFRAIAAALWFEDVIDETRAARPAPPIHPRDKPTALFSTDRRRFSFCRAAGAAI